ncbi:ribonuclease HII [Methanosphaera sp.]|uniref:ribonuclease HII n=1 Tax=Methanosphaera sp. TaxID=2666342 RepID=UPI002E7683D8|nr:ribonuclease HII [Methanosphaera sp.]MEE1118248.1 ribonuclease HII [Methanosphaera sp.]
MDKLNDDSLVLGIDEAGRGSVIGPLVIGGVLMKRKKLRFLDRIGVKDSKKLSSKTRTTISRKIKKITEFKTVIITADEIDNLRNSGTNLNKIETNAMTEIIKHFNPDLCCIDCIDVNEERFHNRIQHINHKMKVITEHKADDTYNIVSAASIIAKVERDKQLAIIRNEYGAVGSGYPSDKHTISYLKSLKGEYPPIVRQTWNTIKNIEEKE